MHFYIIIVVYVIFVGYFDLLETSQSAFTLSVVLCNRRNSTVCNMYYYGQKSGTSTSLA
jgi:hypothetical protein